jgi:hypothetical protein
MLTLGCGVPSLGRGVLRHAARLAEPFVLLAARFLSPTEPRCLTTHPKIISNYHK